jgi:hypothetical protein
MTYPLDAAGGFISDAVALRDEGRRERVLIENLTSRLREMFPEAPAWVSAHIREAEAQVQYLDAGTGRRAHIDNLVGFTTIEYEHDLRKKQVFETGLGQVHQHIAGLLNAGAPRDKIIGILSDTVQWRVYRVRGVTGTVGSLSPTDIDLEQVVELDLSKNVEADSERIVGFLDTYLGREASQFLAAKSIAVDLGFESSFGTKYLVLMDELVLQAQQDRPEYSEMVRELWSQFAGYVGAEPGDFDHDMYVKELYVVTLAKLICANVLAAEPLHSEPDELKAILDGRYFRRKGLSNLVEYDYFGWLNDEPYVDGLVVAADEMQRGLRAFDFQTPVSSDLFGSLLSQLADRSQRLLLGQELTPPWLAERLASKLTQILPSGESPRFLDMCCGSGSMIVEVLKLVDDQLPEDSDLTELVDSATGFDIDPLAVVLARINWVMVVRGRLTSLTDADPIAVPVYHADSMFAKTPIGGVSGRSTGSYTISLGDHSLQLPAFLGSPEHRSLFDALVASAYRISMKLAADDSGRNLTEAEVSELVSAAQVSSGQEIGETEAALSEAFIGELIDALTDLQMSGLNGIWAFVLGNGYRPELLAGQFNGIITNPPWLALSKLADNPYKNVLQQYAQAYGIQPTGAAHLHTELSTTFLLRAVDRFLAEDAVVGCVLPETVLNGYHHEGFRQARYRMSSASVNLKVEELWRVGAGTFKNDSIVVIGSKRAGAPPASFPGAVVLPDHSAVEAQFENLELGAERTVWTDAEDASAPGLFDVYDFRQGADIMPRTAVFHETTPLGGDRFRLEPIDIATSANAFLISGSHKLTDFRITPGTVPTKMLFDVLISKHLAPFDLAPASKGLLPFERDDITHRWRSLDEVSLAVSGDASEIFDEICREIGEADGKDVGIGSYQDGLDYRRKLTTQEFPRDEGFLVVYGAGGEITTAAFVALEQLRRERLVIDQTLYFLEVEDRDEAVFLTGILNSRAMKSLVGNIIPRGAFGGRHQHKRPPMPIPPFDVFDPAHASVVAATNELISEFGQTRASQSTREWLDPNRALASRRTRIREILSRLDSYDAYEAACRSVFALPDPS